MVSGAQKRQKHKKDELAYYLTLIQIEGHTTWRAHLSGHAAGFETEWRASKHPVVTRKQAFRIDRITGDIKPI